MQNNKLTQILSTLLSSALLATSMTPAVTAGISPASQMPSFVRELTPPTELGYLERYYKGSTEKPIILIEDLHANYGVQKNIYNILKFLQPKIAPNNSPVILGMEGAWGDIPMDRIRKVGSKMKEAVGEILLKEAEITGMQHFAAMTEAPIRLVGIEDQKDYKLHQALFRESLESRLNLANKVEQLRTTISENKKEAPRQLKKTLGNRNRFSSWKA